MRNQTPPKVIMFSTPSCSYCNIAKRYFREHKIRFKDIDITRDQSAARDMHRRTGSTGVPVILLNNKPVIGFDKPKLNRLLNIRNKEN